ncbi:hypothetical protein BBD42_23565 [Paenibacillus sp. BIHB 4019]|uniref:HTH LytTR-type domain-containing protein n=1 Tax=Paenibacillus sp. BIHB 4019 TaxID=1870819 RepID=A0A1B2DTB1_9BACL|nr:hypothetical protein BBD42_23565 [Paenibacillus sp. BIHB 4019]
MDTLTVSKDELGTLGLVSVKVQDIIIIKSLSEKKRIIIHTLTDVYYTMGTLVYWETALNSSGYNFLVLDRSEMINQDKVILLNPKTGDAYFERFVNKQSKKCGVAYHRVKDFVEFMLKYNPEIQLM